MHGPMDVKFGVFSQQKQYTCISALHGIHMHTQQRQYLCDLSLHRQTT